MKRFLQFISVFYHSFCHRTSTQGKQVKPDAKRQGSVLCPDCVGFLFQLCARAPAGARSGAVRNPAMPLPVAEEGIAGNLQRSENRRNSVSPNDSPGTAKRVVEGFSSQRLSATAGRSPGACRRPTSASSSCAGVEPVASPSGSASFFSGFSFHCRGQG